MFKPARKIYDWAAQKAVSRYAPFWLGVVFLLEMVFFLPLDALLMLFCWENPKRRYLYALVATISSVVSGLVGFLVGYWLWDIVGSYVIGHLISESYFNRFVEHYNQFENWAVLIGSFLPIPFKIVSLSAGFCKLALIPFIGCVLLARASRFFLIAKLMHLWGEQIKGFVDRHFNRIIMAVGAKIAFAITFLLVLGH